MAWDRRGVCERDLRREEEERMTSSLMSSMGPACLSLRREKKREGAGKAAGGLVGVARAQEEGMGQAQDGLGAGLSTVFLSENLFFFSKQQNKTTFDYKFQMSSNYFQIFCKN